MDRKSRLEKRWNDNYSLLLKFIEEYGTPVVPGYYASLSYPSWVHDLSRWCAQQRTSFRKGSLKFEQQEKLRAVDFVFSPSIIRSDIIFDKNYDDFLKYTKKYGHGLVPEVCEDFPDLPQWVETLKSSKMAKENKRVLDDAGFVWKKLPANWQNMFFELIDYKNKYNTFDIPAVVPELKPLRSWVLKMKQTKRWGKGRSISNAQIQLLDAIGFDWVPTDDDWDTNFQNLKKYHEIHGHTNVSTHEKYIRGLGYWTFWIRNNKSKLTKERIKALDELGFEWDSEKAKQIIRQREL